jgi:RHS repeat-associated protein
VSYTDHETGLQYVRARFYDPATGQFVSRDPALAATREAYAYASADPVNLVDPTGLDAVIVCSAKASRPITKGDGSVEFSGGAECGFGTPQFHVSVIVDAIAVEVCLEARVKLSGYSSAWTVIGCSQDYFPDSDSGSIKARASRDQIEDFIREHDVDFCELRSTTEAQGYFRGQRGEGSKRSKPRRYDGRPTDWDSWWNPLG